MELFRNVNVDWMSKKWYFLGFSLIGTVAGLISIFFINHIPLGVDFKGGTIVYVQFQQDTSEDTVRTAVQNAGVKDARIQSYDVASKHEMIIALEQKAMDSSAIETSKQTIIAALDSSPLKGQYSVFNTEIVHPQVSQQLKKQALLATLYSLAGMLVYIAFRFEFIYGVAAVVAVLHDTLFTVGMFSLTNTEMSLTVIAALLTLIGYSMNDTIVVFDRIRENIKLMRRASLTEIVNASINQTLSRTVLTSGLTFLTVASLFFFGGPVLHGFSLALVIGIMVGTYSSIAVAAPMLVAYQNWRSEQAKGTR